MSACNGQLPGKASLAGVRVGLAAGFTLVELLIASLLASIVLGGVLVLLSDSSRLSRIHTEAAQMDESARLAMELLRRELMMAGYTGMTFHRKHIDYSVLASLEPDCGLMHWSATSPHAVRGISPDELDASGCVESDGYIPDTDSLLVWRAESEPVAHSKIKQGKTYLVSNPWGGYIVIPGDDGYLEPESWQQVNEFGPRLYFLRPSALLHAGKRNDSIGNDRKIPNLVRKSLRGNRMVTEPLVPYIEAMELKFAVNGGLLPFTGDPNFQPAGDIVDWSKVSAVKISLLVRSESAVHPFPRTQSHDLGRKVYRYHDTYARKIYSHSVGLRNAHTPETL